MNRIPILAGGAVLAAVVLCGGAVTVASALSAGSPSSEVLSISGVTTADPTATATPTPTATATPEPGDAGGVTVVKPSDPTKIDGKGCAHVDKDGTSDPDAKGDVESSHHSQGIPATQDPDDKSGTSGSGTWGSGTWNRDGSGGGGGSYGGHDGGSYGGGSYGGFGGGH